MSTDRRQFLLQAAVIAAGVGSHAQAAASDQRVPTMPTPRAAELMTAFGLKYPILCAGMAGAALPELAIAISNAGGLGALGSGGAPADTLRQRIEQIKAGTKQPFAVNYLLDEDPVTVPVALDAGAPIIQFAWGIPTLEVARAIHKAGAKMGIQVGSALGARRALDVGSDYLICQGIEAGGHVQVTKPLYEVLGAVIEEAKTIPVIAAGGIANGAHIRRALEAGASGVLIGTRFVATKEASVHDDYKTALTRAHADDTVLTVCFSGSAKDSEDGWPNAPHRVLRNGTFEKWEAAGCPPVGKRPGEGDVLTKNSVTGRSKSRYGTSMPRPNDRGAIADLALYAGQGVDAIRDIPSAGELITRLWKECLADA